jgi:enoyl-CoA hydratase
MTIKTQQHGPVFEVTIDRPWRRNAVDAATARSLYAAFQEYDRREDLNVAVLTGANGCFCAGADLTAVDDPADLDERLADGPIGPMGPTRTLLGKPVIAAIEGYAVAGGLELACWCDLRVAGGGSSLGVFCRRFGVPLVDLGTINLPRLIGQSRAMELILTGREVDAEEALAIGLIHRVVDDGNALEAALAWATELATLPQTCLRGDRLSLLEQWSLDRSDAIANELRHGRRTVVSGESLAGARRFAAGAGRHGGDTGTGDD